MEDTVTRIAGIINQLKTRKLEAILLGLSVTTCLASAVLLAASFTSAPQKAILAYQEAPENKMHKRTDDGTGGAGEIVADIAGAVTSPGVYALSQPARINDLLEKAGGLSEQANRQYVSQTLNLAQTLTDQQKIYIPSLGEEAPELSSQTPPSAIPENTASSLSQGPLLNINVASKDDLVDLPGIGEITAEKIIDGRPYSSVEELSRNGILRKNIFNDVKEKISI